MRGVNTLPSLYTAFVPLCVCTSVSTQVQTKVLAYVPGTGLLHPYHLQDWEGRKRGRRGRQEKWTGAGHHRLERAQLCATIFKRKLLEMGVAAYYSVCMWGGERSHISWEKNLAGPRLQNLTFPGCHKKVNLFISDHCFLLNCPHSHSCFHLEAPLHLDYGYLSKDFVPTNLVWWMHVFKRK